MLTADKISESGLDNANTTRKTAKPERLEAAAPLPSRTTVRPVTTSQSLSNIKDHGL